MKVMAKNIRLRRAHVIAKTQNTQKGTEVFCYNFPLFFSVSLCFVAEPLRREVLVLRSGPTPQSSILCVRNYVGIFFEGKS